MPEPMKTTVEVEGREVEVEVNLPDGYLSPEEVRENYVEKGTVEQRIADRVRRAKSGLVNPDEILEDESFLRRLVSERKDRVVEMLGVSLNGNEPDLEGLREKWREAELKPLKGELESREARINRLLERSFRATVLEAAAEAGIREDLLDVVPLYVRDRVRYDEEFDDFFVLGPDGEFEYTSEPGKGKPPYKTISEFLRELERSGEKKTWYNPKGRSGTGYRGAEGGGRRGAISLEDFEKMDSIAQRRIFDENPDLYRELSSALATRNSEKFFSGR